MSQKHRLTELDQEDDTGPSGSTSFDPGVVFRAGGSYCQRRTRLEQCLILTLAAAAIIIFALSISLGVKHKQLETHLAENHLCLTEGCVNVASRIILSMNKSLDPCLDFYEYACAGWIKNHPIPSGRASWSLFGKLQEDNEVILRNALESNFSGTEAENKARRYYQSCMNLTEIERRKAQPLLDLLQKFNNSLSSPMSGWKLQPLLEFAYKIGVRPLFTVLVGVDDKNTSRNIIVMDQGGLTLGRDKLLNKTIEDDKLLMALWTYMTRLQVLLGKDPDFANQTMRSVIEFEQELAEITAPDEERRDQEKLYNLMKVDDLKDLNPVVNWTGFFERLFSVTDYKISKDEPLIMYAGDFFTNLTDLLKEKTSSEEGLNVLYSYLEWQLISDFVTTLSKDFITAADSFGSALTGKQGTKERWRYCVSDTEESFGFALGASFVKESFQGGSKEKAEEMVSLVKDAFHKNLRTLKWMDKETKANAEEKVESVSDLIGYPDEIFNKTALNERYDGFETASDKYFDNYLDDCYFGMKKNLLQLRKPPKKDEWEMFPQTVNAYYSPQHNQMVFPAGILQPPFYDQSFPNYVNYGGMGVVMGHELTHGFDDQGREFNKDGILENWWSNSSLEEFKGLTQCFIDEYSSFQVNNEHLRGKQTLGENIADNGGLKAAFRAYQAWTSSHGQEQKLPGLNLSPQQLFFLSFAQVWCIRDTPELEQTQIQVDPHSPGKFRVLGTLANSPDFGHVFNCPRGSEMNPNTKCELW